MAIDKQFNQMPSSEKKETSKEIERKFLIGSLPENLEQYPHKDIIQGYLAITPDGTEVRLRQKGKKYFQTVKTGIGKTRNEHEIEITKDQFETLWAATEGRSVEKTRYEIPHEKNTIELDVYRGNLEGLLSAEVEFESEEESNRFNAPKWFSKEVTEDKRYKNQNLALFGKPEEIEKLEKTKKEIGIPEFELKQGIAKIVDLIREKMEEQGGPVIVEVSGGSASGKTSAVAAKIKEVFSQDALIFSMDDYYRGKTFMDEQAVKGNMLNWDQPEALNLELLQTHLEQLKNDQPVEKPIYSMRTGEQEGTETLQPKKVIIIEGVFALNDFIKDQGDVKAFVDIGTHGRVLRRLLRDIKRTGQRPADILKYFSEIVEPMHEKHINSTKKNADLIIKNEYSPGVESERSGLHEVQMKFKIDNINLEEIRKTGAEKLGATKQIDSYYNPGDRNLVETGEILRIRDEADHITLTYKGPKIESVFRERPKFEFEIDKDIEGKFLGIYGNKVKTITKQRSLYQLEGVVFSIDQVEKEEAGKIEKLGNFIEIRTTDKDVDENKIKNVLSKLGLKMENGMKESYFEM